MIAKVRTGASLAACLALGTAGAACYGGGGNNCFPAGTMIQTPGGEARVEALAVGDEVLAYDLASGKEVTTHVVKTHVHHHDTQLDRLALADGRVLEATPEHPLYSLTRKDWVKVGSLAAGEELLVRDGKGAAGAAALTAVESEKNDADVYTLETAAGNYFAAGVLAKYY